MRPLAEVPEEVWRRAPGIVLDVDDTLTRDGVLEVEALAALHAVRRLGRTAMLVTGRPNGWAETMAAILPVALAVGENGAGWAWMRAAPGGRVLERGRFESEAEAGRRIERAEGLLDEVRRTMPDVALASDAALRTCDLAFDVGEGVRLPEARVASLRALAERRGARVVVSSVHLHAIFGGWDKAEGASRAARAALGVAAEALFEDWIFVGDSGNDAPAFARFARTIGVANVKEHLASLPVPPRFVTEADRGRGVAELVRAWTAALERT
jgi:HAD superfamily hydrolase (TIGR01484 family)